MVRNGILLVLLCSTVAVCAAGEPDDSGKAGKSPALSPWELSERIDSLVEQAAVGPLAPLCNDADFLRRVHLDLVGVIPSATHTQTFLADTSPDKRSKEIERLLSSPDLNRCMTLQLSVWLLERRAEKNVPLRNWERFIFQSIENNQPLDQLMSQLLYAEPSSAQHPATKFILTREAEPNAVTRDVGRLAFGMDLQCAQCHHHPLIDSYHQEDYYGLYAFLHRTALFTHPSNKQVQLIDKPEGEASFRSVFTGTARDHTTPRLPKEISLFEEPTLVGDQLYREKPSKESGGVPAFSRRQALAKMLSSSQHFRRNLANRLWAMMLGRGIVHPLDFHHRDNPPGNPALIDLLARELAAGGYQLRPILAGIALSRTYQRSCEAPLPASINFSDVAARRELLQAKLTQLHSQTDPLKAEAAAADLAYNERLQAHDAHALEQAKLLKETNEAHDKLDKAQEAFKKANEPYQKVLAQSQALGAAVDQLNAAAALIPDDKQLPTTVATLAEKANKLKASLPSLEKAAKDSQAAFEKANIQYTDKQKSLTNHQAARVPVQELTALETRQVETNQRWTNHLFEVALVQRQLSLCHALADYQSLRNSDAQKAAALWQTIVDQWTVQGQLAPLKPLTPEQFTLSIMQGTGVLQRFVNEANTQAQAIQTKAKAEAEAKAKAAEKNAEAKDSKSVSQESLPVDALADSLSSLEQLKLIDGLRSKLDQFAALYGGLPGEDFQATVNQALFVGNGNVLDEWLKPGQGNLTEQLSQLPPEQVAEKMTLSVLSRFPDESERKEITQSLTATGVDKHQAINQWLWALLSSSEFRFNH